MERYNFDIKYNFIHSCEESFILKYWFDDPSFPILFEHIVIKEVIPEDLRENIMWRGV